MTPDILTKSLFFELHSITGVMPIGAYVLEIEGVRRTADSS